jgi:hypothetical protein
VCLVWDGRTIPGELVAQPVCATGVRCAVVAGIERNKADPRTVPDLDPVHLPIGVCTAAVSVHLPGISQTLMA